MPPQQWMDALTDSQPHAYHLNRRTERELSDEEPSSKRQRRGKYVSKACGQCQKRKIKCDGEFPCEPCLSKGRDCFVREDLRRGPGRTSGNSYEQNTPESNNSSRVDSWEDVSNRNPDLVATLDHIQRQLGQIMNSSSSHALIPAPVATPNRGEKSTLRSNPSHPERVSHPARDRASHIRPSYGSGPSTFSGETSIARTLHEMEDDLRQMGVACPRSPPPRANSQPLTPVPEPVQENDTPKGNLIQRVLSSHGVIPNKAQWVGMLRTFCEEVHILYPFLHLPTIWEIHHRIWDVYISSSEEGQDQSLDSRVEVAQVLLCLATGRCTESTRKGCEEARHSAGWSLYRAAMDILGDLLELFSGPARPLEALQVTVLAVIYLFRIEANNKTEKMLTLAISHSHLLGLHRKEGSAKLPIFQSEMLKRVWWCIYIWDRRLAIDTGRPFSIQDVNVDVPLPLDLGEEWISRFKDTSLTSDCLKDEIQRELSRHLITPLPHISAMVIYSRVVGKVWEAHYGAGWRERASTPLVNEYLELLVSTAIKRDSPTRMESRGAEWWQIKQQRLMRIRWLFLRLLIRKPMLKDSFPARQNVIENQVICMQLCRSIIEEFDHIPEKYPKHTFPFIHYVASATMIGIGLFVKQPLFENTEGEFIARATRLLRRFCNCTWVSGRMLRMISRLNQLVPWALDNRTRLSQPQSKNSSTVVHQPAAESLRDYTRPYASTSSTSPTRNPHASVSSVSRGGGGSGGNLFSLRNGDGIATTAGTPHSANRASSTVQQTQAPLDTAHHQDSTTATPSNTLLSSADSSGLADLVMTDFDFEETPQNNAFMTGSWSSGLGFAETAAERPQGAGGFLHPEIQGIHDPLNGGDWDVTEQQGQLLPEDGCLPPGEIMGIRDGWIDALFRTGF